MRLRSDSTNFLLEEEKEELFECINHDTSKYALRNKALFYVAKYCALRASEVGLIQIEDYDFRTRTIYCKRLKGSRSNMIKIIDSKVHAILYDYYTERMEMEVGSTSLFVSQHDRPISRKTLDYLMRRYCSQTSIPVHKWHFHVLKHTRAMELIAHLDLRDVQWWLGHKNISNTMIYLCFTTAAQEALYNKLELFEN